MGKFLANEIRDELDLSICESGVLLCEKIFKISGQNQALCN